MPAERIRDPRFQISIPSVNKDNTDTTTVILDGEGNWCDIPCAHDTQTFIDLVEKHFKQNVNEELHRLEQRKAFLTSDQPGVEDIVGVGLLYYGSPHSDAFEQEEWKSALAEELRRAGLDVDPIPNHLFPSTTSVKGWIAGHEAELNPHDYWPASDLLSETFVLAPALSRFGPIPYNIKETKEVTLGYNAAIGIDGSALLGLLHESDIQRFSSIPGQERVFSTTLFSAVKKLI